MWVIATQRRISSLEEEKILTIIYEYTFALGYYSWCVYTIQETLFIPFPKTILNIPGEESIFRALSHICVPKTAHFPFRFRSMPVSLCPPVLKEKSFLNWDSSSPHFAPFGPAPKAQVLKEDGQQRTPPAFPTRLASISQNMWKLITTIWSRSWSTGACCCVATTLGGTRWTSYCACARTGSWWTSPSGRGTGAKK